MKKSDTEIDLQTLETDKARLKVEENALDLQNKMHGWQVKIQKTAFPKQLVLALIPTVLGVYFTYTIGENKSEEEVLQFQQAQIEQQNRQELEFEKIYNIESSEERINELCRRYDDKYFTNLDVINRVNLIIENGKTCERLEREQQAQNSLNAEVERCETEAKFVSKSCRAYDKSGFHGRPSASCGISLNAGEGRFFNQDRVEVVSQYYRKLSGKKAIEAILPRREGENIVSFSGRISCSNSTGTGKTCESKVTVRAKSYPLSCKDIL